MDNFKKSLKTRSICLIITALIVAAIYVVLMLVRDQSGMSADTFMFITGTQAGIFFALEAVLIGTALKYIFAIKNSDKLQALYIKENDERNAMIKQMTGSALLPICAIGLGIAANVAIYYSFTVFLSLIGAIGFMAIVKVILRLYYGRKY